MTRRMRTLRWIPLLLLLPGCMPKLTPEAIRIGHLAPVTGADRFIGEHARFGVRLAVEEACQTERRIQGRAAMAIHVDSQGDATTLGAEAVRLLTVNRVSVLIGCPGTPQARALLRAAQTTGVPVIFPAELPNSALNEGAISVCAGPVERGKVLAQQVEEMKLDRVAILIGNGDEIAADLTDAFTLECRKEWKIRLREWALLPGGERPTWVEEVKKFAPGAVLIAARPKDFFQAREELRRADIKVPLLYGGEDLGVDALTSARGDTSIYLATVYRADSLSDKGKEFARRYETLAREPPDFHAAMAHDATRLVFDQMLQANSTSILRLRDSLTKVEKFESVTGPLSFKDKRCQRRLFVVQIGTDGQRLIRTIEPGSPPKTPEKGAAGG